MTDKQIDQEEMTLYEGMSLHNFYRAGKKLSPVKEKRLKELRCLKMIDSQLAYDSNFRLSKMGILNYSPEAALRKDLNNYHSYLLEYVEALGVVRVIELIQQQMDSIASIQQNVFTDSEGLSYNSIIYKQEA